MNMNKLHPYGLPQPGLLGVDPSETHPLLPEVLEALRRCEVAGLAPSASSSTASMGIAELIAGSSSASVALPPPLTPAAIPPSLLAGMVSSSSSQSMTDDYIIKYIDLQRQHAAQLERMFDLCDQFSSRYLTLLKEGAQRFTATVNAAAHAAEHQVTSSSSATSASSMGAAAAAAGMEGAAAAGMKRKAGEIDTEAHKKRRGNLPKRATNILKKWLFEHLFHPYPSEEQKRQLASQTGLTINQISNWFINARRRILQPMLETVRQQQQMATGQGGPGGYPGMGPGGEKEPGDGGMHHLEGEDELGQ